MLNAKRAASVVVVTFAAGCFDATLPPPQSPSDPANPSAVETPMEVTAPPGGTAAATASPSAASAAPPAAHGAHQHDGGGQK